MSTHHVVSRCRGCNAQIIWVECTNPGGGTVKIPVNAVRVRTYLLEDRVEGEEFSRARPAMSATGGPALSYVSHFLSCPKRANFSKAAHQ